MRATRMAAILLAMTAAAPAGAQSPEAGRDGGRRPGEGRENPLRRSERMYRQMDRDGDGFVERDEMPARLPPTAFDRIDADGDGRISREEYDVFIRVRLRGDAGGGHRPPAGGADRRDGPAQPGIRPPDFANVRYGPHERNVFDLWKAEGEGPRPLVIFYHGGGFRAGDKSKFNPALMKGLLDRGISFAAANYRLTDSAPYPAPMRDSARALQFIRLNAKTYGIDPARVGATGGSAGAGISQWLLMRDDLADPSSDDPVLRQSSRVRCAVATAAQSTYDPREHRKMSDLAGVDVALFPLFGLRTEADVDDPKFHALFEDASPLHHASSDDGPLMLYYPQPNIPLTADSPRGLFIHHPMFGFKMKEKLDALGVECVLKLREDYEAAGTPLEEVVADQIRFFVDKLLPTP